MNVNVGTIGHVDHGKKLLVVGAYSEIIGRKLAAALAITLTPGIYSQLPSLPPPKPDRRLTAADLERIEAAEAKRLRRIQRNQQRSS